MSGGIRPGHLRRGGRFWGRRTLIGSVVHAVERPGGNALLIGAGGIGKTSLALRSMDELLARESGVYLAHFAATTATRESPLAVFVSALGDYERFTEQSVDRVGQAIIRDCVQRAEEEGKKASPGRLLILIDDVPLLDSMSALVVDYLVSRTDVRVILTCRSTPGPSAGLISAWRAGNLERIVVPSLTAEEVAEISAELLSPRLLAPETQARLAEVTGGNALFLTELLRSLDASAAFETRHGLSVWRRPLPAETTLSDIIRAELTGLAPEKRAAFETVALCAPVPLRLLQGHVHSAALAELADDGLIVFGTRRGREQDPVITLAHPIYGETMSGLLNAAQVWARFGELYDAVVGGATTTGPWRGETADLLTVVFWGLGGGRTVPLPILDQACALARSLADYDARIRLSSALLLHPEASHGQRIRAYIDRIEAYRFRNNPAGAEEDFLPARELCELLPAGPERAELATALALITAEAAVMQSGRWRAGLDHLDWAEGLLGDEPEDGARLRRLEIARGIYLAYGGAMHEAAGMHNHLYAQARSATDFLPLASSMIISLAQRGEVKRARAVGRQQLTLAVRSTREQPLAIGDIVGAWCLADMFAGNVREASAIYAFLNLTMERNPGHVRVRQSLVAFGRGLISINLGEWGTAVTNLKIAYAELEDFAGTASEGLLLAVLSLALGATGDLEGSADAARQLRLLRGRTSALLEMPERYYALLGALYQPGGASPVEAREIVERSREYGFTLMELRGLHAVALCAPEGPSTAELERAREIAGLVETPLAALLLGSLEHIARGGERNGGSEARALARRGLFIPAGRPHADLTGREQQLAELLALGFSNKDIAKRLTISKRTVETHAAKILQKLQVSSRDDVAEALAARD